MKSFEVYCKYFQNVLVSALISIQTVAKAKRFCENLIPAWVGHREREQN